MMRPRHSPATSCKRAMTLIEVLVAGTILTIVLGMAFGMMTESQTASRGIQHRQTALQTSETAMRLALQQIQSAVHPVEFGASSLTVPAPQFASDSISFARYEPDGTKLNLVTLRQTSETMMVRTQEVPNASAVAEIPLVRPNDNAYAYSIAFAYAAETEPGMPPAYQPTFPVGTWPAIVRVTVTATPRSGQSPPIILESAVIPGVIPNRLNQPNAPAAAPTPAAATAGSTSPTIAAPAAPGVNP